MENICLSNFKCWPTRTPRFRKFYDLKTDKINKSGCIQLWAGLPFTVMSQ